MHARHRVLVPAALIAAAGLPGTAWGQAQRNRLALDDRERTVLSWGATARVRAEGWSNFAFGPPASPAAGVVYDQVFSLLRAMAHVRLDVADRFTFFVQAKTALTSGRELPGGDRPIDEDRFDVQQAYAQVRLPAGGWRLALSGGREDLTFGRERLVGPLDWVNSRRTFQGASLVVSGAAGSARLFWVRPVQVRPETWNIADSTRTLFGLHVTRERARYGVDAYWLGAHTDVARFNATTAADRRSTVGARVYSRGPAQRGALDADVEVAYQFGEFGTADVSAVMVGSQAGWRPTAATRVYAGFDFGSGDDSTAGRLGTFHQLYPTGHAFLGFADVHGRQNVAGLSAGGSALVHRATVLVDVHAFWRANARDGLYGVDGSQARAAGNGLSRRVGTELDLTLRYPLRPNAPLAAGYSVYLPGRYLEQSGTSATMHFGYVQLGWTW
jgi:hypothetical protein